MTRKNESITLSVPQELKQVLERIAIENNCLFGDKPSISALVKAIALGELTVTKPSNEIGEAITAIQTSLKELAKSVGCQHPNPTFNQEFGFYQCPLCGEVWAYDNDDPDYTENPQRVTIETDNPKLVAALISGELDEVM